MRIDIFKLINLNFHKIFTFYSPYISFLPACTGEKNPALFPSVIKTVVVQQKDLNPSASMTWCIFRHVTPAARH